GGVVPLRPARTCPGSLNLCRRALIEARDQPLVILARDASALAGAAERDPRLDPPVVVAAARLQKAVTIRKRLQLRDEAVAVVAVKHLDRVEAKIRQALEGVGELREV